MLFALLSLFFVLFVFLFLVFALLLLLLFAVAADFVGAALACEEVILVVGCIGVVVLSKPVIALAVIRQARLFFVFVLLLSAWLLLDCELEWREVLLQLLKALVLFHALFGFSSLLCFDLLLLLLFLFFCELLFLCLNFLLFVFLLFVMLQEVLAVLKRVIQV